MPEFLIQSLMITESGDLKHREIKMNVKNGMNGRL